MFTGALENFASLAATLADAALPLLAFLSGGLLAVTLGSRPTAGASGASRAAEAPVPGPLPAAASPVHPSLPVPPVAPPGSAVFGHEVKNYLCTLKGSARLLRVSAPGPAQSDLIDRIDRVVERLEDMAWKTLDEGPGRAPDVLSVRTREAIDLVQMARACARLHFAQSGGDFPCQVAEGVAPVLGDPHRLEQVFRNLYGNALEAGATTVSTRFRRIGGEVEIAIEDDGRGCPEEVAGRIFEPFFSTKEGKQARGLGLFIVQSIVGNHGGRIKASPKNGRGDGSHGLVVYLNFPVSAQAPAPADFPPYRAVPDTAPPVRTAA